MEYEELMARVGLSEGQLREAARIREPRLRALAAVEMAYLGLDPQECAGYVDRVLASTLPAPARKLLSSVSGAVEKYRAIGGEAELTREDSDNGVKLTVRLAR